MESNQLYYGNPLFSPHVSFTSAIASPALIASSRHVVSEVTCQNVRTHFEDVHNDGRVVECTEDVAGNVVVTAATARWGEDEEDEQQTGVYCTQDVM